MIVFIDAHVLHYLFVHTSIYSNTHKTDYNHHGSHSSFHHPVFCSDCAAVAHEAQVSVIHRTKGYIRVTLLVSQCTLQVSDCRLYMGLPVYHGVS